MGTGNTGSLWKYFQANTQSVFDKTAKLYIAHQPFEVNQLKAELQTAGTITVDGGQVIVVDSEKFRGSDIDMFSCLSLNELDANAIMLRDNGVVAELDNGVYDVKFQFDDDVNIVGVLITAKGDDFIS